MLSATALLASAGSASAKYTVVCFGSSPAIGVTHSGVVYNAQFLGTSNIGFGLAGDTKGIGKNVDFLSDNYFENYRSIAMYVDVSLPLKNGGTWTLWLEQNGTSGFPVNAGTYTINCTAPQGAHSNILAGTRALIEKLRKNRQ